MNIIICTHQMLNYYGMEMLFKAPRGTYNVVGFNFVHMNTFLGNPLTTNIIPIIPCSIKYAAISVRARLVGDYLQCTLVRLACPQGEHAVI